MTRRTLIGRSWLAASFAATLQAAKAEDLKIAITTDEVAADLEGAIPFLKRHGLRHAEIRNVWGKYNTSQPEEMIVRARKLLDEASIKTCCKPPRLKTSKSPSPPTRSPPTSKGPSRSSSATASEEMIVRARKLLDEASIKTCILDTGFFKVPLPAEDAEGNKKLDKQWALLDKAFKRAEILGTDLIRVFAFTHPRGEQPNRAHYPRIVELVAEAARRAKSAGFRFALENVGGSYVATAEHLSKLAARVPDETLGFTWDPNNSAGSGDPSPYPDGYKMLDPARILHVHLRDYKRTPDGGAEWCGVGDGEFDHLGQIRALIKDGYKGALSLETHFKIDDSKAKASEFSMTNLLEVVKKV